MKVDDGKVTVGLDNGTMAISLKAPKGEIRRNGSEQRTIYRMKKHEKRSDAFGQKQDQTASVMCLLAFNEGWFKGN